MGTCIDCEENFEFDIEETDVGDILVCPKCKCRLEVLDLNPVVLDYAVDEDEET